MYTVHTAHGGLDVGVVVRARDDGFTSKDFFFDSLRLFGGDSVYQRIYSLEAIAKCCAKCVVVVVVVALASSSHSRRCRDVVAVRIAPMRNAWRMPPPGFDVD